MLSKHIKTHYILLKEGNRGDIKKIPITNSQYTVYKEELEMKKHNEFFTIEDIETQETLFEGRCNKIEGFEQIKIDKGLQQATTTCSFGEKHPLSMCGECDCSEKYGTLGILFKDKLKDLGYNVLYDTDITKEMQEHYLRENKEY